MICDNCGNSEWVLTTVDIVEPDESRTTVRICYTCRNAELPEAWRKETVFDQVAQRLKSFERQMLEPTPPNAYRANND